MSVKKVYRYRVFDIHRGESVIPPGRATRETIETMIKGEVIEESEEIVDSSLLDGNGMIRGESE